MVNIWSDCSKLGRAWVKRAEPSCQVKSNGGWRGQPEEFTFEKKHCLGQRYVTGNGNQQMDVVVGCPGAQDWKGLIVSDPNEIHTDFFAQCVGERVTTFKGAEGAMNLGAGT